MAAYTRHRRISFNSQSVYSKNWVYDSIATDPAILDLGDLVLRDRERTQNRVGHLRLLSQGPETYKGFEVELQLGSTDQSHKCLTYGLYSGGVSLAVKREALGKLTY